MTSEESEPNTARKLVAEAIGTFFLFLAVIGSGIMAEDLASGNGGVALISNTLSIGAILFVLISMLGPISGAHFNPAVTLAFVVRREIRPGLAAAFVAVQVVAGSCAGFVAHVMFTLPVLQVSDTPRTGVGQWAGEFIATFGLVLTILLLLRYRPAAIPAAVALYISSAIWFTSSTSFANPAIAVARTLTDTYTGIAPGDAPMFIAAQLIGSLVAVATARWLTATD
ncbi:MAG: aquaporin [Pseudomonadota bacterium]